MEMDMDNLITPYMLSMPKLYRVREAFNGDDCDLNQYSYVHDLAKVRKQRFNKKGEQVLYTSTYPNVAVMETGIPPTSSFYISRWKKRNACEKFLSFIAIDNNCSTNPESLSRQVRIELERIFSSEQQIQIDQIRNILEKDYSGVSEEMKYEESSSMASMILEKAECIVSYSMRDNRQLNITFNKKAVDEKLCLDCVFYCGPQENQESLCYKVSKIGIVDNGKIVWYGWEIDESSIGLPGVSQEEIHDAILSSAETMCVNVNSEIDSEHQGILTLNGQNRHVKFKIKLIPNQ